MSYTSYNDLEDLLEKSIDENYAKNVGNKPKKCPFNFNVKNRPKFTNHINRKINKVEEKTEFNPLLLPEGWVRLFHESGMFFYCHVSTKVVTWSMPYQLQTEPPRYHRVPVRSIPCLSFTLNKNEEMNLESLKDKPEATNKIELAKTDISTEEAPNELAPAEKVALEVGTSHGPEATTASESGDVDKEDGEIESSDEDSAVHDKTASKDFFLPKQYQIEIPNHKSNRSKINSMSETLISKTKDTDEPKCPAKRRKINSDCQLSTETDLSFVQSSLNNSQNLEPHVEIKSEPEDLDLKLLEPSQLRNYCNKLFTFVEELRHMPRFFFKNKFNKNNVKKTEPLTVEPSEQTSTTIVTHASLETMVPITCTQKLKIPSKNIHLELAGRNFSCILNMYCQNAFGVTPSFNSSSSLSGIHDFEVSCDISGTTYATGEGRTKRIAKQKAVLKTLEILVPGFLNIISGTGDKISITDYFGAPSTSQPVSLSVDNVDVEIYSIFDNMDITDPRVLSYTSKLNSMTPYNMLVECMNRHCVMDSHLVSSITKQNKHNVFKLKLGDKEVQANCENKREGKQLASQYMLAKLHPHIQRWGGILRLYGPDSKPVKRFDMHEMQNLLLEDRGGVKSNLINLLRKKMLELNEEWQSTNKTYAKFKVPFENVPIIVFHPDSQNPPKS